MQKAVQIAIVLVSLFSFSPADVHADQITGLQDITIHANSQNIAQNNFDAKKFADAYFKVWNDRALDRVGDYYAEDIHYRDLSLDVSMKGIKALKEFMQEQFKATPDLKFKAIDVIVQSPEKIAIQWLMTGTDQGESFEIEGVSVMELKQGKVIKNTDYYK